VVILTALKEEYDEAREVDDGAVDAWTVDTTVTGLEVAFRTYRAADGRPLRIALTWATRMRTTAAADAAARLVDKLGARCVAMAGVCAGRRGKVHPGDVIIGSLLYTYDTGEVRVEYDQDGTRHERFQAEPNPYPLDEQWLHRAQAFKSPAGAAWITERPPTLAAQCDWVLARLRAGEDPIKHAESASRCPAWPAVLGRLRTLKYVTPRDQPKITKKGTAHIEEVLLTNRGVLPEAPPWASHVAPIATGSNVMRDPKLFDKLSDSMRTVFGVEMEAAAIAAIAHARKLPWMVMKGVMDHADQDKDDQLKAFAARASAECLIRFLRESLPANVDGDSDERPVTSAPVAVGKMATSEPPKRAHALFDTPHDVATRSGGADAVEESRSEPRQISQSPPRPPTALRLGKGAKRQSAGQDTSLATPPPQPGTGTRPHSGPGTAARVPQRGTAARARSAPPGAQNIALDANLAGLKASAEAVLERAPAVVEETASPVPPEREQPLPDASGKGPMRPDRPKSEQRSSPTGPTDVFLCSAPEDSTLRDELERHLAPLIGKTIHLWHPAKLPAGEKVERGTHAKLDQARLVLALTTANLLSSDACMGILERARARGTTIVPVVAQPCLWEESDLAGFQALPAKKGPVSAWSDRNEAWLDVVRGVRSAVRLSSTFLNAKPMASPAPQHANPQGSVPAEEESSSGFGQAPKSPDDDFEEYLAAIESGITSQLDRMPAVVAALARQLRVTSAPGEMARTVTTVLLHQASGKAAVVAFNAADEEIKHDAARTVDRHALRNMMLRLLPVASDWRPYVQGGRAKLSAGQKLVDLPLGTMTMAETILAGIDCRCCQFVADSPVGPVGGALVRKPVSADFFLDPKRVRLAQATVGILAVGLFHLRPDDPSLRDHARMRTRVDEALQYYGEVKGDEYLPRWILLDDVLPTLVSSSREADGARVDEAVAILGDELPHLRILRMGSDVPGEINYAMNIGGMWRKHL